MPAFQRSHPVRDLTRRRRWSIKTPWCQACGIGEALARLLAWPGLETHHIVKCGRSDEETNFLRLCRRCHQLAEGLAIRHQGQLLPTLPLAVCLTLKQLRDPREFDSARLTQLYHQALPAPEPVPEFFVLEFQRRRG